MGISHVAVELLLAVLGTESFALEGTDAAQATRQVLLVRGALAQEFDDAGLLHLLLEALLETVTGFVAVLDCVDGHRAGRE